MSQYTIEIDDGAIVEQMNNILDKILQDGIYRRGYPAYDAVNTMVKELIYKHKDEILEKVINKASAELVRKGLPKLLERGVTDDNK